MREEKLWRWRMAGQVLSSVSDTGEMCIVSRKYSSCQQRGWRDIAWPLVGSVAIRVCVATNQLDMVNLNVMGERYRTNMWTQIPRNFSNTVYGYAQENTRW